MIHAFQSYQMSHYYLDGILSDSIVNNKAINVKCLHITTKPQNCPVATNKMVMFYLYDQTNSYLNMPPLAIWSAYTLQNITKLKNVQRHSARLFF